MKRVIAPDFSRDDEWTLQYRTNLYFPPKIGDTIKVRMKRPIAKEQVLLMQKYQEFRYGLAYKYISSTKKRGGMVIRPMNRDEAIKAWGPLNDEELWLYAILIEGEWRQLRVDDNWGFDNFKFSDDEKHLENFALCLNDKIIQEYNVQDP